MWKWKETQPSELYHHGIKGQRWGVRRYRAKAGKNYRHYNKVDSHLAEEHYIRKGTKIYRTTTSKNESGDGSAYVTYQKADRDFYKRYITDTAENGKAYEKEYVAKKDIVVPSREEVKHAYEEAIKAVGRKTVDSALKEFVLGDISPMYNKRLSKIADALDRVEYPKDRPDGKLDLYDDYVTNKKLMTCTQEEFDFVDKYAARIQVYDKIVRDFKDKTMSDFAVGMGTLTKNPAVKDHMIKTLSSKGYNAMVDEAGVGTLVDKRTGKVNREGVEPLILFDRSILKEKRTVSLDYNDSKRHSKMIDDYWAGRSQIEKMQSRDPI